MVKRLSNVTYSSAKDASCRIISRKKHKLVVENSAGAVEIWIKTYPVSITPTFMLKVGKSFYIFWRVKTKGKILYR